MYTGQCGFIALSDIRKGLYVMRLNILGTGGAAATKCYNTCFALSEGQGYFLVDTGGGNGILSILDEENIPLTKIHDVFITHGHNDHVLGVIWIITMIGQLMNKKIYEGELRIFCHAELKKLIVDLCELTLHISITCRFDRRIRFISIEDGDTYDILNNTVKFFDIHSTKLKQFGFCMTMNDGMRLGFCGDEPLDENAAHNVDGCDWLIHEAFCLYAEKDIFHPYRRHHSTVKDACEIAERLCIRNLILCHTEDRHIRERKGLYTKEGKNYFSGNLFVPDDRECIEIG